MLLSLLISTAFAGDSLLNTGDGAWTIHPHFEIGFLAPLTHRIQLGTNGSDFDFIEEGGQDNLFRVQRFEMGFQQNGKHHLNFIFQPCDLATTTVARKELTFDNAVFADGTPMAYRYGFDYYRGTYLYDTKEGTDEILAFGVAMQIRNATLDFRSQNGEIQDSNRDIGPVPLLTFQSKQEMGDNLWWGVDAAGSYAPIKYINGSDSDVVGAILDASLRGGLHLQQGTDAFVNLRYIGGGAEGTDSTPDPGKDGYVLNWLNFMTLTVGVQLK